MPGYVEHARVGAPNSLLDLARHLALGPRDVEGLVHGLVPRLFLGVDVHRSVGGLRMATRTWGIPMRAAGPCLQGPRAPHRRLADG